MSTEEHNIQRKLAAILSADVVGYSRMMAEDEVATVRTLNEYRRLIHELAARHHGRVVDAPGDNVLAEFPSAIDATECAIETQRSLAIRNRELLPNRRMSFRIGIHLGDVMVEGERIYGDGVNIAARLEHLATPGGICISGSVHDQVRAKLDAGYQDLGNQQVKNIPHPVHAYQVRLGGLDEAPKTATRGARPAIIAAGTLLLLGVVAVFLWKMRTRPAVQPVAQSEAPTAATRIRSIAVLPLENLSGDPAQEFFADGMTEELITDLAKISALKVISRTSVMQFKGEHRKPLPEIARMLNVDAVIEGSVFRVGDKVRITAQLIDAPNDKHMWAQSYERDTRDVLAMQDEVASAIATQINVELTPQERRTLAASQQVNPAAYEAYLKGRYYSYIPTGEGQDKALRYFQQSIAIDPTFALGYAGLSDYYWNAVDWHYGALKAIPKARQYAQKALQLNASVAEAHAALANVSYSFDFDWVTAEAEFRRAIQLSPGYVGAHNFYGQMLGNQGRFAESYVELEKARQLDPLSGALTLPVAFSLANLGQFEKAMEYCRQGAELAPDLWLTHLCFSVTYGWMGKPAESVAEGEKAYGLDINSYTLSWLGYSNAVYGSDYRARSLIELYDLESRKPNKYISPCAAALIQVGLVRNDQALDLFEKCYQERSQLILSIKTDARLTTLRSNPRFVALLKKIGLDNPADDYAAQGFEAYNHATTADNARARTLFQAAIDLDPKHAVAQTGLGATLWYPWFVQWDSDPASLDKALEQGRKAVASDDASAYGHILLAEVYATKGLYDQAIDEAKRPIAQIPGAAGPYSFLGFVLNLSGRPAEAVEQLKRAAQLDVRDQHLDFLGWSYAMLGRYDESIAAEKEFVIHQSNPLLPHVVLAFDYAQLGKLDAARAEAKEILRISPKFTTDGMRIHSPYKDPAENDRWASALRKAGLN